jgi:hypothetical protein
MLEKIFIIALKRYFPQAQIIGFQHTRIPPFLLSYFPPKCELGILPAPHKIICSGNYAYTILKEYWNGRSEIREGCALKHAYLFETESYNQLDDKRDFIGVAMPVEINDALELMVVLGEVRRMDSGYRFLIKLHPMTDENFFLSWVQVYFVKLLGNSNLLLSFRLFKGNVPQFLSRINMLIYTSTDLAFQTASIGIPVICYIPYMKIDKNAVPKRLLSGKAFDAETLNIAIKNVSMMEAKSCNSLDIIKQYYNRIEERFLKEFLN